MLTRRNRTEGAGPVLILLKHLSTLLLLSFPGSSLFLGSSGLRAQEVSAGPDAVQTTRVRDAEEVCVSCIELALETTVGDTEGPGVIEESQFVGSDQLGRFWVTQRDYLAVFDSDGTFVAKVGQRGKGPLEFTNPLAILGNDQGEIAIFDPGNSRVTMVDTSFQLVRELSVPIVASSVLALPGRDRYLLTGVVPAEASMVQPLHILEGSRITRSFGRTEDSGFIGDMKRLAADDRGRVFAADMYAYRVDAWTVDGQLISQFERPGLWTPPEHGQPAPPTPADPDLPSLLAAIQVSGDRYLWVVSWVPQEDAREHLYQKGRILDFDDWNAVYDSVIEIIDVDTGLIIARTRHPEVIGGFLAGGFAHGPLPMEDGTPRIAIWRVALRIQD